MSRSVQLPHPPSIRHKVSVRTAGSKGGSKVKFGSVTVTGAKPSADLVRSNIERSTKALERVSKMLTKPGVVLRRKRGVPQFFAADDEPGVFIRRLNGQTTRGRLVDGSFQVID